MRFAWPIELYAATALTAGSSTSDGLPTPKSRQTFGVVEAMEPSYIQFSLVASLSRLLSVCVSAARF